MTKALIHWCLSALALWIVSMIVPGFMITSIPAALIAAVVIGLANATLGFLLKIVTFPLTIITLGLFWFIINALMIEIASSLVPGFLVANFASAFLGAIVLSIVNMVLKALFERKT